MAIFRNLTEPTRFCGALGVFSNETAIRCLAKLGFTLECGSIWWWNIINTREECTWVRKVYYTNIVHILA